MVFPDTPLDVRVELQLGATWTDITEHVYPDDGITITRGRPDEASRLDPSRCTLTLYNDDGRFSPRNPVGPYYGMLGRNTPLRVSVAEGTPFLHQPKGGNIPCIGIVDNPQVSVTGDIDIRIDLAIEDTSPDGAFATIGLASHYNTAGDQRAWAFLVTSDGHLQFTWSPTGVGGSTLDRRSTIPLPTGTGRRAYRVTLDVNNGSSGHTVTFYTAATTAGPWVQLGDAVTVSGVTSIFNSSADLFVGYAQVVNTRANVGRLYKFELRNGINGAIVANPDCTIQTPGVTSFVDTAPTPSTWFVINDAEITNRNMRFVGEVSTWPSRAATFVRTTIEASGILRRLGQGTKPLRSALFRFLSRPSLSSVVGYWPCEDGTGARTIASGRLGHPPGRVAGRPDMASFSDYMASDPLPVFDADTTLSFQVPAYTVTIETALRVFMNPTVSSPGATRRVLSVRTTGTAARWEVETDGQSFRLRAFDASGTSILTTGYLPLADQNLGKPFLMELELTEVIGNVIYALHAVPLWGLPVMDIDPFASGSLTGRTVSRVSSITVAPDGGLPDYVVGQVILMTDTDLPSATFTDPMSHAITAYIGELSGTRISRLASEEGITFERIGRGTGVTMGAQIQKILPDLLQECSDADFGTLYESRQVLGIGYRELDSLYNQTPQLTLNYEMGDVAGELIPTDDDQYVRNDITVNRQLGSMYRVEQATGPLSTLPPPDGVGRYQDNVTVSLETEQQLPDAAGWRLHVGTMDEARYPQITVNLGREPFEQTALTEAALLTDAGSRIDLTGLPDWLPPGNASQIVQGYTEQIEPFRHEITFNCTPESAFEVGQLDDPVLGNAGTSGSELTSDITDTATSFSVTTVSGPAWTNDPADFPIDINVGGERMTVTNIAGASSPQTFTVARSTNGVVKSHAAGAGLTLWQPMILAF